MSASLRSALTGALVVLASTLGACASTPPPRDPTGEVFPEVQGETLEGEVVQLPSGPDGGAGRPLVLLVGFEMEAQFDLDRWILGLLQAETPAHILEVPTIPGLVPGMFAGRIDEGMRGGIPSEDWGQVVTVYGDGAKRIERFTGNDGGRNGRVLLLEPGGRVAWFHDRGYSGAKLLELDARVRAHASGSD